MLFTGFSQKDFNVFDIEGLDDRMEGIKTTIRPKLEALGQHFTPTLSALSGDEMFYHVAKHARRTKNPPKDTWVAFANNKRGYKMMPHFQIGLWKSHVFVWFAVIYESPIKESFGQALLQQLNEVEQIIPSHFVWSKDHTQPEALRMGSLQTGDLKELFTRLQTVKKAEILCGINIPREKAIALSGEEWLTTIEDTFKTVLPLYKLAQASS
ncbi:YktB family protein [Bacillus songklensis]|uniref:UPF0637 protein ACFOU2_12460 n=1 Tax=Bacillus songklensis TaxID=1069116 RepID=A0ABV8B2X3_9BACI